MFRVRHDTAYDYSRPVELGSHLAHLLPRAESATQRVLECRLDVEPEASFRRDDFDHFGNRIVSLFVEAPHTHLRVVTRSLVEVDVPAAPAERDTPAWETIRDLVGAACGDAWSAAEFVEPSPLLPRSKAATRYALESFSPGRPVLAGLRELNARIRRDFEFKAGATTLRSTVGDVLRGRAGVCQDFSHLMIAGLRGLGLPARYMSGYVRTHAPAGTTRRPGSDVSHAWVGAWLGPEHGWLGLDPTNNLVVRNEHVLLGWGRDFSDVSPLFGVILGGGKHTLKVGVDLAVEEGGGAALDPPRGTRPLDPLADGFSGRPP